MAALALDKRVGEAFDVAARLPDSGVHEDAGVETLDVGTVGHHIPPPALLDVALEFHPERPVVPDGAKSPIDFGRLVDEASPLAERDQLLH